MDGKIICESHISEISWFKEYYCYYKWTKVFSREFSKIHGILQSVTFIFWSVHQQGENEIRTDGRVVCRQIDLAFIQ